MSSPEPARVERGGGRAQAEAVIVNEEGLHLRPATSFASIATKSACAVTVTTANGSANGKSVLELAMLAAPKGTCLSIVVEGADCDDVLATLVTLVASGFRS